MKKIIIFLFLCLISSNCFAYEEGETIQESNEQAWENVQEKEGENWEQNDDGSYEQSWSYEDESDEVEEESEESEESED